MARNLAPLVERANVGVEGRTVADCDEPAATPIALALGLNARMLTCFGHSDFSDDARTVTPHRPNVTVLGQRCSCPEHETGVTQHPHVR